VMVNKDRKVMGEESGDLFMVGSVPMQDGIEENWHCGRIYCVSHY